MQREQRTVQKESRQPNNGHVALHKLKVFEISSPDSGWIFAGVSPPGGCSVRDGETGMPAWLHCRLRGQPPDRPRIQRGAQDPRHQPIGTCINCPTYVECEPTMFHARRFLTFWSWILLIRVGGRIMNSCPLPINLGCLNRHWQRLSP
jgi:hypothetical protein